jgi:hypothetical protein
MRYIILLLLVANTLVFTVCNGQSKPIGDAPLNLAAFNFKTSIASLYPAKNKSRRYKNAYEVAGAVHSQLVITDTTFATQPSGNQRAIGIEYRQQSSTSIDTMAVWGAQSFQKVNIATTLDGRIKVVSAVAEHLTSLQSGQLIEQLTATYGTPKKSKISRHEGFTRYEWTTASSIIRFVSAVDDESATLKMVVAPQKSTVNSGKKEPHVLGYLFLINPVLKQEVFGNLRTGDFMYLD